MRMIDLGSQSGVQIMGTPTTVECGREMRLRRSFRTLVECMVPCCGFQPLHDRADDDSVWTTDGDTSTPPPPPPTRRVTGTFFGQRKGRVSFCLQDERRGSPLLLLELAVPTAYLAREMQCGVLRIALLECSSCGGGARRPSLFNVPLWSMYCNGRKVGYAVSRQMTGADAAVLKQMQSVSVGAGVLRPEGEGEQQQQRQGMMYMRATFDRVIGSPDSESFHMINPTGSCSAQQLCLFLLRSS